MKIEGSTIIFSSGREEYALLGIVGLSPDLGLSYGYDGGFDDREWTADERRELAEFMIERWTAYKAAAEAEHTANKG